MTKKINAIKISDVAIIEANLAEINGRADTWTASAEDIVNAAHKAEADLASRNLAASFRKGAIAVYRTAGPAANAYRNAVRGNEVVLKRFAEGWRVIEISKVDIYPKSAAKLSLTVTAEQRNRILRAAVDGLTVKVAA